MQTPLVMGIINMTNDSFYEGSRHDSLENALGQARRMIREGADILDVGGQSTRPGATKKTAQEEMKEVIPFIERVRGEFPNQLISIDTFYSETALKAIEAGADIINDVYGGREDDRLFEVVGKLGVPYILMHSKGDAATMKDMTNYDDYLREILDYFETNIRKLRDAGVKDIILDPGFGFAKTIDQNYALMKSMEVLKIFNLPVLVGISRKSMVYQPLQKTAAEALNGTTVLNTFAITKGASILRVHDVEEAKQVVLLTQRIYNA